MRAAARDARRPRQPARSGVFWTDKEAPMRTGHVSTVISFGVCLVLAGCGDGGGSGGQGGVGAQAGAAGQGGTGAQGGQGGSGAQGGTGALGGSGAQGGSGGSTSLKYWTS